MPSRIEDFIRYVAQFDPTFPLSIRGASEKEILRLEALSGIIISSEYREFLLRMGHESGKLGLDMDGTADITDVIQLYERCIGDTDFAFPASCLVIVTGRISHDIYVDFSASNKPRVVYVENGEIDSIHSENFLNFLYRCAFDSIQMPLVRHYAFWTSSFAQVGYRNVLSEARVIANELGFSEEWFSDSIEICGTTRHSYISITQFEEEGLTVSASSKRLFDLWRIGRKFKKRFGLELDDWRFWHILHKPVYS